MASVTASGTRFTDGTVKATSIVRSGGVGSDGVTEPRTVLANHTVVSKRPYPTGAVRRDEPDPADFAVWSTIWGTDPREAGV